MESFWRTDGKVNQIEVVGNLAYLAGDFTYVGPPDGTWGVYGTAANGMVKDVPQFNGIVQTALSDGQGGWYVGGRFRTSDPNLSNLVHVLPSRQLDAAFRPNPDNLVRGLHLSGTNLLVIGAFSSIAGSVRPGLVALDPTTGGTNDWPGRVDGGAVLAMAVSGNTLYLGGTFTSVNGTVRNKAAAIGLADAQLLPWNPGGASGQLVVGASVRALAVGSNVVYAGGEFSLFGNRPSRSLAAVDAGTGVATDWKPTVNGLGTVAVNALAVIGNQVIAGGNFNSAGGRLVDRLAVIDATTSLLVTNITTGANGEVFAIEKAGENILVGGAFTQIGGKNRYGFAAIRVADGQVLEVGPQVSGFVRPSQGTLNVSVLGIGVSASEWVVGGNFLSIGGGFRGRAAAIDLLSGSATPFNPAADAEIRKLAVASEGVYLGGNFTNLGDAVRPRVAQVDRITGVATAWNGKWGSNSVGSAVLTLAARSNSVYVGGIFQDLGGVGRTNFAQLDGTTGDAMSFAPAPTGRVWAILPTDKALYVGGEFGTISGRTRQRLAMYQFDTNDVPRIVDSFTPNPDNTVETLHYYKSPGGDRLFVGGLFGVIAGQPRRSLASIDPISGLEGSQIWDTSVLVQSGVTVRGIFPSGPVVYAGGNFRAIGNENRLRVAAVSRVTGNANNWDPSFDGVVHSIVSANGLILVGGEFARVNVNPDIPGSGRGISFFAAFEGRPSITSGSFKLKPNGDAEFEVNEGGGDGSAIAVEATDSLSNPNWQTMRNLGITGRPSVVTIPAGGPKDQQFYRVTLVP